MEPSDARKLNALESENAKFKNLLAEQMLDNAMLRDVNSKVVTPDGRRQAVAHLCVAHGISQRCSARRVCTAIPEKARVMLYMLIG